MIISLLQTNIIWEDIDANLRRLHENLKNLHGTTEIVILPEMFTTGFSMNTSALAETVEGKTCQALRKWASEFNLAICGSFICKENGRAFNRAFFFTPEGGCFFYDKKHLFRMGNESSCFTAGNSRLIVTYKEWRICLLVCYDLRFPVWSRNSGNAYDLLIYVANWPHSRRDAWDTLLKARAIENQCYVAGINRTGNDGSGLFYSGGTVLFSPKGKMEVQAKDGTEEAVTAELDKDELQAFRQKFPVWMDADDFKLM